MKNRCPLTPIVSKCSSGALEFQDIYCIESPERFFTEAKGEGYKIVAADSNKSSYARSIDIEELSGMSRQNKIIVLGSEGSGISQSIQEVSDMCVNIRSTNDLIDKFPYSLVDSLNVGVASGILLQAASSKPIGKPKPDN